MPRDGSREALALAGTDHVDQLTRLEQRDVHRLARLVSLGRVDPELRDVAGLGDVLVEMLELARHRRADLLGGAGDELQRGIAVTLRSPESRDGVRGSL